MKEKFEGNAEYEGMVQPVSNKLYHVQKGLVAIGHKWFENSDNVMGRHPGLFNLDYRGSKGGRRRS